MCGVSFLSFVSSDVNCSNSPMFRPEESDDTSFDPVLYPKIVGAVIPVAKMFPVFVSKYRITCGCGLGAGPPITFAAFTRSYMLPWQQQYPTGPVAL